MGNMFFPPSLLTWRTLTYPRICGMKDHHRRRLISVRYVVCFGVWIAIIYCNEVKTNQKIDLCRATVVTVNVCLACTGRLFPLSASHQLCDANYDETTLKLWRHSWEFPTRHICLCSSCIRSAGNDDVGHTYWWGSFRWKWRPVSAWRSCCWNNVFADVSGNVLFRSCCWCIHRCLTFESDSQLVRGLDFIV